MKIELNLDTEEKQALFLLLFNRPVEVLDFVEKLITLSKNNPPSWQSTINNLSKRPGDVLLDLIAETFPFEDWEKVQDVFFT